ncbi:hypothetical protein [Paenirhodobacter sp.]|uniref:hypothetical protein n=1 Tax=Paenirhodobacter sp. TaxID=1965326 RepID=UPI003B3F00D1
MTEIGQFMSAESVDRPISIRLREHLRDRLNGRWNRFSWFGLRGVDDAGRLTEPDFATSQRDIIALMEGILIETLEPPLNRKRGDDFSAREYLQVDDPGLEERRFKETVEALWKGRRN